MVALVEDVNAVLRCRQDGTATEAQVREHEIVVGDDDVRVLQAVAGPVEGTVRDVRATAARALALVSGYGEPVGVVDGYGPAVAIPVPVSARERIEHGAILIEGVAAQGDLDLVGIQAQRVPPRLRRHEPIELAQAQIPAAAFGKHVIEVQARAFADIGKILVQQLLLQRHRCRGDDQPLAPGPGQHEGGNHVGDGFAGPRARLDDRDRRDTDVLRGRRGGLASAAADAASSRLPVFRPCLAGRRLPVGAASSRGWRPRRIDAGQRLRHLGDHLTLAPARCETARLDDGVVSLADGRFFRVRKCRHGVVASSRALRRAFA